MQKKGWRSNDEQHYTNISAYSFGLNLLSNRRN